MFYKMACQRPGWSLIRNVTLSLLLRHNNPRQGIGRQMDGLRNLRVGRQLNRAACTTHSCSKVPPTPTWEPVGETPLSLAYSVSPDLMDRMERLALVDFRNHEGVARLQCAITFADQLHIVDTEGVEPMDSVLEDMQLYLRPDTAIEGDCAEVLLRLPTKTVEEFYVAPPGNIPLPQREERCGLKKKD
ncbi:glutamyl-tRNA(Gln) amidotransferase subunit C, mitochondrial [Erpetoichthys calabaricus]|uniref:glutamyl-tRNA(Gln) amidotransferase subunit C, mitochondrial n=1 Tax=Erpetoichthys calabaricus TaxID=27687 RepID=UPI0022344195|nr:glutamyl-tRNA(Gln) amidotransferase subunit C, mitochondrial [Erpetoichthys calabaricus]